MQYPGFIDGSYNMPSVAAGIERTVNMYPEIDESGHGKNKIILQGTPGLSSFCDLGTAKPVRMIDWHFIQRDNGVFIHAISNTTLFRVNVLTGAKETVGTVANDGDQPAYYYRAIGANGAAASGDLIVSGGHAYFFIDPTGSGAATLTDLAGTGQPFDGEDVYFANGAYLDGYFLLCDSTHGSVYFSTLDDPSAWNLLDYFQPLGGCNRIQVAFGELWCQSFFTTEVFYNSGDPDTPFKRVPGSRNNQGFNYPFTVQNIYNSLIWVGAEGNTGGAGIVYQATSYVPTRISTHAVEEALKAYLDSVSFDLNKITTYTYTESGHSFYVINIADVATWVYDCHTTRWHERAYSADDGVTLQAHLGRCQASLGSTQLVGSRVDGIIYKMNDDNLDDAGKSIFRMRQAPHLLDEEKVFTYHNFQLDMDVALDTVTPTPTKTMNLSWSNDGGKTFTTALPALIGNTTYKAGTKTRVIWRRLGSARDRVFRVTSTAAIKHTWTDAFLNNLTD